MLVFAPSNPYQILHREPTSPLVDSAYLLFRGIHGGRLSLAESET